MCGLTDHSDQYMSFTGVDFQILSDMLSEAMRLGRIQALRELRDMRENCPRDFYMIWKAPLSKAILAEQDAQEKMNTHIANFLRPFCADSENLTIDTVITDKTEVVIEE